MGISEYLKRVSGAEFRAKEDDGAKYIEGYFAVFDSVYQLWDKGTESVACGAFDDTLEDDIRALCDHDSRLVLGRTTAKTLELRVDNRGLFGCIKVNESDLDALNLYARVLRGDVSQCSFGFDIIKESYSLKEDGSVHWLLEKVKLWEVSVVTFPAYEDTQANARKVDFEKLKQREFLQWKESTKRRIKVDNGA